MNTRLKQLLKATCLAMICLSSIPGKAQTAPVDATGPARLTGTSQRVTTVVDANSGPGTIQEWLDANAGKRFVLSIPSAAYTWSLYVTSAAACMQYYNNGWQNHPNWNGGPYCVSAASSVTSSIATWSYCFGYGSITVPWSMEVTPYGWNGVNLSAIALGGNCVYGVPTGSITITSSSQTY